MHFCDWQIFIAQREGRRSTLEASTSVQILAKWALAVISAALPEGEKSLQ